MGDSSVSFVYCFLLFLIIILFCFVLLPCSEGSRPIRLVLRHLQMNTQYQKGIDCFCNLPQQQQHKFVYSLLISKDVLSAVNECVHDTKITTHSCYRQIKRPLKLTNYMQICVVLVLGYKNRQFLCGTVIRL